MLFHETVLCISETGLPSSFLFKDHAREREMSKHKERERYILVRGRSIQTNLATL